MLFKIILVSIAICCAALYITTPKPSQTPVLVVIPVVDKDLPVLPYTVASLRQYLRNPIEQIILLAPQTPAIKQQCKELQVECMDENKVLNKNTFIKLAKRYQVERTTRAGGESWLYQQLLKLYFAKHATTNDYLIVDADIVLQRPLTMKTFDGSYRLFRSEGLDAHPAFSCAATKLLGVQSAAPASFISHTMLFNKQLVAKMIATIEQNTNQPFTKAVLEVSSKTPDCVFSEYETYAEYAYNHPELIQTFRTYLWILGQDRTTIANKPWWHKLFQIISYHAPYRAAQ